MKYAYFALPIALSAGLFFFFNSDDALTSDPQGPLQVLTNHNPKLEVAIVAGGCELNYADILHMFFRLHDPTTLNQQGNDRGTQYRSAIFYTTPQQQVTAERIKQEVDQSHKWPRPLTTQIVAASDFYEAESYHQDYLQKHPNGYTCHYLRN